MRFGFESFSIIPVISLVTLILFLAGCSSSIQSIDDSEVDAEPITGNVVEEAENCRFADPEDCSPIEITRGEPEEENALETPSAEKPKEEILNMTKLSLTCTPGWECIEGKYIGYHEANCSWHSLERCIYGCNENESACTGAPICKVGSLRCEKDNLMICGEKGYKWLLNKSCDKDCENNACTEDINATATSNETTNATNASTSTQNDFLADMCINVANFNYNASGPDNSSNLNDEYFTLRNSCLYSVEMTNWIAKDASTHDFTFPSFNLGTNTEVTIRTGSGTDDSTNLYWESGIHIWNNGGDTLYINISNGTSVLTYTYP